MTPSIAMADFAAQVLRAPLWSHQQAAADCDSFIVTIAGGRRSGKSQFAQVRALWVAATVRNARVLVISPAVEGTRAWVQNLAEMLRESRLKDSVVDDQKQVITFSNGSEIRCVAATSAQIRGRGRNLRLAVVDEAAFVAGSVWRDLYYTLFDLRREGSQAVLCCSPWGPPTHFFRQSYDNGVAGQEGYASFRWTMQQNPTLDQRFIDRERERIAPSEAAAEIDGIWQDAAGALFSQQLLESITAPVEVPTLAELRGPARSALGIDWGVSYDRSACVALYRLPVNQLNPERKPVPTFLACPTVWPLGHALNATVDELVTHLAAHRFISPETNGIGHFPSSELQRRAIERRRKAQSHLRWTWNLVNTTASSKTAGYSLLLGLAERAQLVLPPHPDLQRQLAGIRFEQRERGFTHIAAEDEATHDDVADALYLATLPHKSPTGHRLLCHLGALASSQTAPPDTRVPNLACGLVETGSGLKLPVKPTLQSVAGVQFTPYAPVEDAKEGFRAGRFWINSTRQGVVNA